MNGSDVLCYGSSSGWIVDTSYVCLPGVLRGFVGEVVFAYPTALDRTVGVLKHLHVSI